MKQIVIVGCGPGSPACLTGEARSVEADALLGSRRLLALFETHHAEKVEIGCAMDPIYEVVDARRRAGERVAVLVSGDPGVSSLSRPLVAHYGTEHCRIIPGISSVQVAFARLGRSWQEGRIVSAHGRVPDVAPSTLLRENALAILGGGRVSEAWLAEVVALLLENDYDVTACQNLTLKEESVVPVVSVDALADCASRTILVALKKET